MVVACIQALQVTPGYSRGGEYCEICVYMQNVSPAVSISSLDLTRPSRPSVKVSRVRYDNSTSNLSTHVKQCTPNAADNETIDKYAQGSSYTVGKFRYTLLRWPWIVVRHCTMSYLQCFLWDVESKLDSSG